MYIYIYIYIKVKEKPLNTNLEELMHILREK